MAEGRSRRVCKRKLIIGDNEETKERFRKCEKAGCPASRPNCCAAISEVCSGGSYTSRWYHLSDGEHFCNACFDHTYRSHKGGYTAYAEWKLQWSESSRKEPSVKVYMVEMVIPYWLQCNKCHKWRQLPRSQGELTKEIITSWVCADAFNKPIKVGKIFEEPCKKPEAKEVVDTQCAGWLQSLAEPPLLKHSPAANFLQSYFPDGVGMSATTFAVDQAVASPNTCANGINSDYRYLQPFYEPENGGTASTFRPDVMETEEIQEFPEFSREPGIYLALRNMILALWSLNCKEPLSAGSCAKYIIIRGLVRRRLVEETQRVLFFLTKRGYVNHGILNSFTVEPISPSFKRSVVVVGAGASGLAAARHLQKFGFRVTVLEARNRIGGRVCDDFSFGCCVGKGAQILNGCVNNPISVLTEQLGLSMKHIRDRWCDLLQEDGQVADANTDRKMDFHFNALLDAITEWRKNKSYTDDVCLEDKIMEMHKAFVEELFRDMSELENRLLQFHIGNLEFSCAAPLTKVSAMAWDQNEIYPQFFGDHTLLTHGFGVLLKALAHGLHIEYKAEVKEVNYSQNKVDVYCHDNRKWTADKVIVTVPLAILKADVIQFTPPLPSNKLSAIKRLGAGLIEKIALKFPYKFWQKKIDDADFFGHLPKSNDERGLFGLFYDLSPQADCLKEKSCCVLMTILSGEAAWKAQNQTDKEIIDDCMRVLNQLFPEDKVPEPQAYFVTRWGKDPYSRMAYSYVPVGCTGEEYDELACAVEDKLFFAGEATNRQFPQTVTGAYTSGIREAIKILSLAETT